MKQGLLNFKFVPIALLSLPLLAWGQPNTTPSPTSPTPTTPTPTAVTTPALDPDVLQQRLHKLQDELNEIEVESEKVQHRVEDSDKSPFQLTGGSLEQDLESNNNSWSILQGQTLHLQFLANPSKDVTGHLDMEFWGYVAADLTQFNIIPTLANQGQFMAIREMDATFDAGNLSFTAFKGIRYGGYYYTHDDLYYLFPDVYDLDKPFRYTGNAVPIGMNVKGKGDLDGLEIWAGPTLQWGTAPEAYLMYQHKIGPATLGAIDKIQFYSLGQPTVFNNVPGSNPPMAPTVSTNTFYNTTQAVANTTELYLKIPFADAMTFDGVVLYSPYNVGIPYTYVQNVAPGMGAGGSPFLLFKATAAQADALGYQVKLTTTKVPFFDSVMVNGEYSGILAGDRERISAELAEVPATNFLFTVDATVQKPIIGPNPTIAAGPGYLLTPRNGYDAFQVNMNPISGVNNREMAQFSLSFVFNPGNGWFFRYNPNMFAGYNINTDLDTPFSIGVIGTLVNYPTGTDLFSYVNGNGVLTWEGPGSLGQAPTNGYQPYAQGWAMWRTDNIHWVLGLEGGFSQSSLSYNDVAGTSFTNSFSGNLTARINNTSLQVGYGIDNWGPEDWNRQFGMLIGQQYLVQVTQKFGNSSVSLKYVRWDNLPGSPYQFGQGSPGGAILYNEPFPLDEIYATYLLSF